MSSARTSSASSVVDAHVDLDLDAALAREAGAEALERDGQRLVRGRDQRLDRAPRVLERAVGGVDDLDAVRRLGQAAGAAADEGELLGDAVVQLAREPAALAVDGGLGALAHARAHLVEHADEQRDPAGHAQDVAEVHVVRGRAAGRARSRASRTRRARRPRRPSAAAAR